MSEMKVKTKKIKVKWSKKKFGVSIVLENATGRDLKVLLEEKTGVPINRQKIFGVGPGELQDDSPLKGLKIKKLVSLIGTSEKVAEKPKQEIVFSEDIRGNDEIIDMYPCGLNNLQNTCYLNSVLQVLNQIPEIRKYFKEYNGDDQMLKSLKGVFSKINSLETTEFSPFMFVTLFRSKFPKMAEQDKETGIYFQQDAHEFLNIILNNVFDRSLTKKLFKGWFEVTQSPKMLEFYTNKKKKGKKKGKKRKMKDEGEEEEEEEGEDKEKEEIERLQKKVTTFKEEFSNLPVHIGKETNVALYGIEKSLVSDVELGGEVFTKQYKIDSLPEYMVVNYVRFFYNTRDNVGSKIVKRIKYEFILDVMKFCTEPLQKKIQKKRQLLNNESLLSEEERNDEEFKKNVRENYPTGYYELFGIVTHQGRRADSGHYIGWSKCESGEGEKWVKFDDDVITEIRDNDDILRLAGGLSDHHITYIAFYRSKGADGKEIVHKAFK